MPISSLSERTNARLDEGLSDVIGNQDLVHIKKRLVEQEELNSLNATRLSDKITIQEEKLKEREAEIKQLEQQMVTLRLSLLKAEERADKIRLSINYRLGETISNALKSWKCSVRLPYDLYLIKQESKKRNKLKKAGPVIASAAMSDSAHLIYISTHSPALHGNIRSRGEISYPSVISNWKLLPSHMPHTLRELRVAAIMDDFTWNCYKPECHLMQLTPDGWREELETFKPHILFIESAWRGKDDLWTNKVCHMPEELRSIVAWCRSAGVKTLLWNKEDPVHFQTFLKAALYFDHVFTTDVDCVQAYKNALGHDRVHYLPFAAQPTLHNPVEKFDRQNKFSFAGAYYAKYPERNQDLDSLLAAITSVSDIDIYDRNYHENNPEYAFPERYHRYIKGHLPFEEIDRAYKGYRFSLNLNTIKQSQAMFARRVYELLASNTLVLSNYSRGVRLIFGDLIPSTDSTDEAVRQLTPLLNDEQYARRVRLAGLRKAYLENTYEDRLRKIFTVVFGKAVIDGTPSIGCVAYASNKDEASVLIKTYQRQMWARKSLILVLGNDLSSSDFSNLGDTITFLSSETFSRMSYEDIRNIAGNTSHIAFLSAKDWYGENYLTDLALAVRYQDKGVIGKAARYRLDNINIILQGDGGQYRMANALPARSSIISLDDIGNAVMPALLLSDVDNAVWNQPGFSIDEYNYLEEGQSADADSIKDVSDLNINIGLSLSDISVLEAVIPSLEQDDSVQEGIACLAGDSLFNLMMPVTHSHKNVSFSLHNEFLQIESTLGSLQHSYFYHPKPLSLSSFLIVHDHMRIHLEAAAGLDVQTVLIFLDRKGERIDAAIKPANRNFSIKVPNGTASVRFGLRVMGTGVTYVRALWFGFLPERSNPIVGAADHLILTNHYPAYDDLYRNGFVHRRAAEYKAQGIKVDVFRFNARIDGGRFKEFEGVDVISGHAESLRTLLDNHRYKTVLVHFLDSEMWDVLKDYIDDINVIVWVHGAEIQPWHRRSFNYTEEKDLQQAKKVSAARETFWKSVLTEPHKNLKLVFVSNYFAEEVMEDMGLRLDKNHYEVIHNFIDTDMFSYQEKSPDQRLKILSIRPYANHKYANDLSVKAILDLVNEPWFSELDIRMIGDGVLFDETLAPLQGLSNVTIERRFLSQLEIAKMHKDYGVFLCPTRMDAQGVSRDEAMSSGLVPVTNAVTAIPEFVDNDSGILAPGEDYKAMADGIRALYNDKKLFSKLSKNASERVKRQSGLSATISQEVRLICDKS